MEKYLTEKLKNIVSKFSRVIFFGILILLTISLVNNIFRIRSSEEKIKTEENKIVDIKKQHDDLQQKINEAQSPEFQEKQLRDKLGLAKTGEIVVVLPDEATLRTFAPPETLEDNSLPDPNWKKWVNLFF